MELVSRLLCKSSGPLPLRIGGQTRESSFNSPLLSLYNVKFLDILSHITLVIRASHFLPLPLHPLNPVYHVALEHHHLLEVDSETKMDDASTDLPHGPHWYQGQATTTMNPATSTFLFWIKSIFYNQTTDRV